MKKEKGFIGGVLSVILGVMFLISVGIVYVLFDTGKIDKDNFFKNIKVFFMGEKKEHIAPFGEAGEAPKPIVNTLDKTEEKKRKKRFWIRWRFEDRRIAKKY